MLWLHNGKCDISGLRKKRGILMKVAIIGAGLAGLSCAHELEKYSISPVIYERNSFIGEAYTHVGAALEIVLRPVGNPITYLRKSLGIDIKPLNTVKSVIHHSPNETTEIRGNLGYFLERSKEPNDIKNQIFSKLKKTEVLFNTHGFYGPLSKEYDFVVIANGYSDFTNELGCWTEWVNSYIIGATILGNFDPQSMIVWINKEYCKNGYAYLTPFDNKRASLQLVFTDVSEKEIDSYWDLFLTKENIKYPIVETYKVNHRSGNVYPHRVGNIFLTGNAGGMLEPFLGFGVAGAIISGVMAARSIVKNEDYEKLLKEIVTKNKQLYEFRKSFNKLTNGSYDMLIQSLGMPGIKHLTYYTPLNVVKYGSYVLKLINKLR